MPRSLNIRRVFSLVLTVVIFAGIGAGQTAELNPKAISIKLPPDIKWSGTATSPNQQAVLYGDPSKEGLYIVLYKWHPNNMSRPHFHPNDRFITVISGTWWVGTGNKYDPESTKPVPAGSFVTHFGKEVHYDGAKGEECILQIVGMGPATSTAAPAPGQ